MAALEKFSGEDMRPGDSRRRLPVLLRLMAFFNAFLNFQIVTNSGKNALTITDSNVTLELNVTAGGGSAAVTFPWQAQPSPWRGQGADPYAATRAARFALIWGTVNGLTPSNMNAEFVAFGNVGDATITADQAVVTFVYWQASVHESAAGQGDFSMDRPVLMTARGTMNDSLPGLVSPPDFAADGSLPSYVIQQICVVQCYGGALHFPPGLFAYVTALPVVTGALDGTVTRQIQYTT